MRITLTDTRFPSVVGARLPTSPSTYKLEDLADDDINGTFYTDELQFVTKLDDALLLLSRIIDYWTAVARQLYLNLA